MTKEKANVPCKTFEEQYCKTSDNTQSITDWPCKIFKDQYCKTSSYYNDCKGRFYQCNILNYKNDKEYKLAINNFNQISENGEFNVTDKEQRTDFVRFAKNRKNNKCKPRLDESGIPRKKTKGVENTDEDFICKCYYLCYKGVCPEPDKCKNYFVKPESDYSIIDYQIPPLQKICGKVDLILKKNDKEDDNIYLTEVKPPKGNDETLLRMICEILTHYKTLKENKYFEKYCCDKYGITDPKIYKAIMFFNGSKQESEYAKHKIEIERIIEDFDIKVFQCDKDTKKIIRLR